MALKIITFGKISELTGKEFTIHCGDTDELRSGVERIYPDMVGKKYAIAVNKKVITDNTPLRENDEVVLLPPYSGG